MNSAIRKYCQQIQLNPSEATAEQVATKVLKLLFAGIQPDVSIAASELRTMSKDDVLNRLGVSARANEPTLVDS